jgi:hypothetical protein
MARANLSATAGIDEGRRSETIGSVEHILSGPDLLALIIRAEFCEPGIHFFTDNTLSQQLAFMRHPEGKLIEPHVHNPVPREVEFTQEVLLIRKGRLRVDFYDAGQHIPPLEAFARNCPVAAARVAGAEEQLENAALLFDPADPADIARAITKLYHDCELRR